MLLLLTVAAACRGQGAAQTQTASGVLLDVVSPSINKIDRFTLRADDGRELAFVAAPNFNEGATHVMTPGHMRQHMALADRVQITYRDDSGTLVALSATDASNNP